MPEKLFHESDVEKFQVNGEVLPLSDLRDEYIKHEGKLVHSELKMETKTKGKESFQADDVWVSDLKSGVILKLECDDEVLYFEYDPDKDHSALYFSINKFDTPLMVENVFAEKIPVAAVGTEAVFKKYNDRYIQTPTINKIIVFQD